MSYKETLKAQLAAKNETIKKLNEHIKALTKSIATLTKSLASGNVPPKNVTRNTRGRDKLKPLKTKFPPCEDTCKPWVLKVANTGVYCWTCGYNPLGEDHTSATCKTKEPGHKNNAMAEDRMGGSEANKPAENKQ